MGISFSAERKIMGISGALLVLFLIMHLAVNLTSLISRETYESAWRLIHENAMVRIVIPLLAFGFAVHVVYGVVLAVRDRNTPDAGRSEKKNSVRKWTGILLPGIIVAGLLAFHLTHFWAKVRLGEENPYDIVQTLFYNDFYVAGYVIWFVALYFHLSRGFLNMFQSANTAANRKLIGRLQIAAKVFSASIVAGFIFISLYFYLGFGYL
jgi:succinate dehydrogenase / fumarate reductase cytochrome b subunit